MNVLVVAEGRADARKTLAAVRALGNAGAFVGVASNSPVSPPLWSRRCSRRLLCPDPVYAPKQFTDWIVDCLESTRYDVVLPLSDHTTRPLVESNIGDLVHTALPDLRTLKLSHDKLAVLQLAESLGIGIPTTEAPGNRLELMELSRAITYPCVIKRRRGAGGEGLAFPGSATALLEHYDRQSALSEDPVFGPYEPLVQELVPGNVHDSCCLFRHGEPRAVLTQRRVVMYPAGGGVGVCTETTDEPQLRGHAEALLAALHWHGPAQVEFKRDARDGRFKLMEINGRFWGTLDQGIQAGINFPWLACRMALDGDVPTVSAYEVGCRYRWPWPYGLRYALETGEYRAAWCTFFNPRERTHSDWQWRDPVPNLVSLLRS